MNIPDFEAQLQRDNYPEITTVTRDAAYALGEHSHPFDACALITQGSISITVEQHAQTYQVGDVFTLAAHTLHTEAAGGQGVSYLAGRRPVAA